MDYKVLYRKYRPADFNHLVGQDSIKKILVNSIINDKIAHAYIFTGPRGTGKTSTAKIFARALNCLNPQNGISCGECENCKNFNQSPDIIELDAASNNSVDDIRNIVDSVNIAPTNSKYKIYIIDEVHMLSTSAWNAFLKTLEEPPHNVIFILATTEPQKLPATILSRCQRFDFKRISNEDIIKRLEIVCKESNIEITEGALKIISVLAEGAMRDALSILERCVQDGENKIDEDKIKDLVGIPKITFVHSIVDAIVEYDIDKALASMDEILNQGKDLNNFLWEIIKYVKDVLIYKSSGKAELYSEDEVTNIKNLSDKVTKEKLVNLIYELSNLENDMKWSTQKTIMFQAGIIKLCSKEIGTGGDIEDRLEKIENYLKSGKIAITNNSTVYNNVPSGVTTNNVVRNNVPKMQVTQTVSNSTVNAQPMTKKYSNDLSKSWPKIVNDLKQNGKIVLYTNLMNTSAEQVGDSVVEIKFRKGMTAFGKAVLDKQENIKEISNLVSMACGKNMQIKYINDVQNQVVEHHPEDDIQKLASESDIPFNIV